MAVVPTGPLSLPLALAARLLAASTTWQQVCAESSLWETASGATPTDKALTFIDEDEIAPSVESPVPRAVLLDLDELSHERKRTGLGSGSLIVEFLLPLVGDSLPDQKRHYRNTVGAILEEMLRKANTPTPDGLAYYWHLTSYRKVMTPQVVHDSQARLNAPDAMTCGYVLEWVE